MFSSILATDLPAPTEELQSLIFLAKFYGAAVTLLGGVYLGVSVWSMLRRQPPVHDVFQTKTDANAMELRLTAEIEKSHTERREATQGLHEKFDSNMAAMRTTLETGLRDLNRTVGQLEGGAKVKQELIDALRETHGRH